jgi:hypothetical protein
MFYGFASDAPEKMDRKFSWPQVAAASDQKGKNGIAGEQDRAGAEQGART